MTNETQPQIDCKIMEAAGVDMDGALQYIAQTNKNAAEYYRLKFLKVDFINAYIAKVKTEGALYFYKERLEAFEERCDKAGIDTTLTDDELERVNSAYRQEYDRLKGVTP